ncbi:hypothetical protein BDV06DRAFT_229200 [Aspergillus oleicola]
MAHLSLEIDEWTLLATTIGTILGWWIGATIFSWITIRAFFYESGMGWRGLEGVLRLAREYPEFGDWLDSLDEREGDDGDREMEDIV